jgi:tetratricopeptide (TPR) repeat protein
MAANNFSAFLIMGGLPEKSIPILEYWNKQKPKEAIILCNLGNAYYRLGAIDKAMKYLQDCVQYDTLNATANKILCLLYLKKGDTKKAEDHCIRSLTTSYDEQVMAMLRQLNSKTKPGEIMSRLPVKEFPMLKRIQMPAMPSALEDMEKFVIELDAAKRSLELTIENIESKIPKDK